MRILVGCSVAAVAVSISIAPVWSADPVTPKPGAGWETTLAIGANVNKGNSESMALNGSLQGAMASEKHEWRLGAEANYAESEVKTIDDEGETTTSTDTTIENAKGLVNYKYKFDRWYGYSDDSIFHDEMADLDYRLILGLGAGRYLIETASAKLGAEAGASFIKEEYPGGKSDDYYALRFAARHDQKLGPTSKCWEAVEYLPRTGDWTDYLLNAEAGVEAAINTELSLRMVLQDRYDSVPADDRDRNDLSLVGSLVFKL